MSRSEAMRLIKQGAVEINGEVVRGRFVEKFPSGSVIKVGKRRFARVFNSDKEDAVK